MPCPGVCGQLWGDSHYGGGLLSSAAGPSGSANLSWPLRGGEVLGAIALGTQVTGGLSSSWPRVVVGLMLSSGSGEAQMHSGHVAHQHLPSSALWRPGAQQRPPGRNELRPYPKGLAAHTRRRLVTPTVPATALSLAGCSLHEYNSLPRSKEWYVATGAQFTCKAACGGAEEGPHLPSLCT